MSDDIDWYWTVTLTPAISELGNDNDNTVTKNTNHILAIVHKGTLAFKRIRQFNMKNWLGS